MTTALVDADGLLYLAAAAEEERYYSALIDGHVCWFKTKKKLKEFCDALDTEAHQVEMIQNPPPIDHALSIAKGKLHRIRNRFPVSRMEIYLKGDGSNFRDDLVDNYKANRKSPRPLLIEEVKQYLMDNWGAIEVSGQEADDRIATRAHELPGDYIVCSPDKDLDQIPGKHWNYRSNISYQISEGEAKRFLWVQILAGDSADNIAGCWKLGVNKAEKLMDSWEGMLWEDVWDKVVEQYAKSQDLKTCPYKDRDPEEVAIETARLVWLQTEPNRLWTPPGRPYEYVEDEL